MRDNESEVLAELREIRRLLEVLTLERRDALVERARTSGGMTTADREKMFSLMNGDRTIREIAQQTGKTVQAVSQFCEKLEEAALIRWREGKGGKRPEAIVTTQVRHRSPPAKGETKKGGTSDAQQG